MGDDHDVDAHGLTRNTPTTTYIFTLLTFLHDPSTQQTKTNPETKNEETRRFTHEQDTHLHSHALLALHFYIPLHSSLYIHHCCFDTNIYRRSGDGI